MTASLKKMHPQSLPDRHDHPDLRRYPPVNGTASFSLSQSIERRTYERVETNFRATVFCHERYQSVLVRNVSCGGVMIANAFGLNVGDLVVLTTLTGQLYRGRTAWCVSPYTGIAFEHTIAPDDPLFATGGRQKPQAAM